MPKNKRIRTNQSESFIIATSWGSYSQNPIPKQQNRTEFSACWTRPTN